MTTQAPTEEPGMPGLPAAEPVGTQAPVPGSTATATSVAPADGGAKVPARPFTLAIDIGGTGLKANVLDATGSMVADRVRVATTYPLSPEDLVANLVRLSAPLPRCDRASAGFPGMVRTGHILTAPHFVTTKGPGTEVDDGLLQAWSGFDLAGALTKAFGIPSRVANDADVQGAAVVSGRGLEMVITLGTGFGTGLFYDGHMLPHLELAHHPFRKGETYNEQLGEQTRKDIGDERWNRRVFKAIGLMRDLVFFDHLYIGGGNSRRVVREKLADDTTIVDNNAGVLGGIKLWDQSHIAL